MPRKNPKKPQRRVGARRWAKEKRELQRRPEKRDAGGRFENGSGHGGSRPGAGRKPSEITELHKQLFDAGMAEAAARVLKAKLMATTPEVAEAFAIIKDRLEKLDPSDEEGRRALATIASVAIAANSGALDAAEYVSDRVFGKPKQAVEANVVGKIVVEYDDE